MPAMTAANLITYALQIAAVAAIGAALPRLLGLTSPGARLGYYRALLLLCLTLPLVQPIGSLGWSISASDPAAIAPAAPSRAPVLTARLVEDVVAARLTEAAAWHGGDLVLGLYVGGVTWRLAWLALGLVAIRRLRTASAPLAVRSPSIQWAGDRIGAAAEFRVSRALAQPVSFGVRSPVVLVPSSFSGLDAASQRAMACHELVHVRRRDWVHTLLEEAVRAVLWFHPVIWWLLDRIQLAREQVVDREVVELTGSRREYLDTLLGLAAAPVLAAPRPASAFLRRPHLVERVALLLKETAMSRQRVVTTLCAMAAVLAAGTWLTVQALPLEAGQTAPKPGAGAQTAPRPGMVPGKDIPKKIHNVVPVYPPDAREQGVEGVVVIEATVDAAGTVTNARAVSSPHASLTTAALEAVRQWRFEPPARAPIMFTVTVRFALDETTGAHAAVNPAAVYPAAARQSGVAGAVLLAVTTDATGRPTDVRPVRGAPVLVEAAVDAVRQWKIDPPQETPTLAGVNVMPHAVDPAASAPLRVGGVIKPPTKITDVRPVYPQKAKDQGLQGVVIIEATIGADGKVLHGRVTKSAGGAPLPAPPPDEDRSFLDLDAAALEAVLQWGFTPTLLNGKPVPVIMTVTVNFTLR